MNSKQKIYLSITTFGVIAVLLLSFGIYPLLKDIQKQSEDFISQKEKMASIQREMKNFKEIESSYKANQDNLNKIDELFVDPDVLMDFISFLEKNAQVSQLKIEISPLAQKEEIEPWPSLSFNISALGSFPDFLKFLEKLENSSYLIEIFNLNIKRLVEGEIKPETFSSGDINATFSIKVYTK